MANDNAVIQSLSLDLGWPSYQKSTVERWQGSNQTLQQDYIAEEVPVSLIYNGTPHVVMLTTPTNIEDFALGFSITEGIISNPSELLSVRIFNRANGIEVYLKIPEACHEYIAGTSRNLSGRTGCGLCGASTLQQVVRPPNPVGKGITITSEDLFAALIDIKRHQNINKLTGSVHAAAWAVPGQNIVELREDIGRHNALDKLIGILLRSPKDLSTGFVIVTSRASYELIQKATAVGITTLAAISAPTGLAIRLADEAGMTLIGFAREDQHVVYTHPHRLIHTASVYKLPNANNET